MNDFSDDMLININAISPCESPVVIVKITHPSLDEDIRVVQDNKDISHMGEEYLSMPFEFTLISDIEDELPSANIVFSNVGRPLMIWLEASNGGTGALVDMRIIRKSDPDVIEKRLKFQIGSTVATLESITIRLNVLDAFNRRGIKRIFDPVNAPGVFG